MPIRAKTNLYPGVNPHLNSWLQRSGDHWRGFHGKHITYLAEVLDTVLPEGYYTRDEASLNIARLNPPDTPESTVPDVSIYREREAPPARETLPLSPPTLTVPLPAPIEEVNEPRAIVIYRDDDPVTRIEVLSPSNKRGGSYYGTYMKKRELTLESGLCVVEIDYLHEFPPIIPQVPNYAAQQPGAFPYHILISVPRPTYDQGFTDVHGISVMDTLPTLTLPLAEQDGVAVAFAAVYKRIYEAVRYYHTIIDYTQEPENLSAYTEADQQAIQAHMATIAAEQGGG